MQPGDVGFAAQGANAAAICAGSAGRVTPDRGDARGSSAGAAVTVAVAPGCLSPARISDASWSAMGPTTTCTAPSAS